jgi:hypothetical protein
MPSASCSAQIKSPNSGAEDISLQVNKARFLGYRQQTSPEKDHAQGDSKY